ncbi:hypothetical protein C1H46_000979 [Malus baccata]|uniref:GHMP kinase N-terminal domain-containing protein n=1 Tax=Malus baccata TaxID=106549 RepID=A0A540NQW1_MALBA|nr:hypothetical protein C1H46_000979 [Malus baccata]
MDLGACRLRYEHGNKFGRFSSNWHQHQKAKSTGVLVSDDVGNELHIEDLTSIATPFDDNDPFRLVKSALLVTGIIHENVLASKGLQIRTWACVPRGSGLGTSSILAAVVVK